MNAYTIVLSPDPDLGGYTASCPAMPGAITEGSTRESTLEAMRGVMAVWSRLSADGGYGPVEETPALVADAIASVLEDRQEAGWDRRIETVMLLARARK